MVPPVLTTRQVDISRASTIITTTGDGLQNPTNAVVNSTSSILPAVIGAIAGIVMLVIAAMVVYRKFADKKNKIGIAPEDSGFVADDSIGTVLPAELEIKTPQPRPDFPSMAQLRVAPSAKSMNEFSELVPADAAIKPVDDYAAFALETIILHKFRKTGNFATVYAYTLEPQQIFLKSYDFGTMSDLIFGKYPSFPYTVEIATALATQVVTGVARLHAAQVSHNDLSPMSIVLEQ